MKENNPVHCDSINESKTIKTAKRNQVRIAIRENTSRLPKSTVPDLIFLDGFPNN